MKIVFLCPHTRISGGVKVIFRLAAGLRTLNHEITIIANKVKDPIMGWHTSELAFKIMDGRTVGDQAYNDADCVITFGDGPNLTNITPPKILFMQGLVLPDKDNENITDHTQQKSNLKYPYDMVIVTSQWLHDLMQSYGHKNIRIVPPGIDEIFTPIARSGNRIPVIGGLFHTSPDKQFNLFVTVLEELRRETKIKIHPLILTGTNLTKVKLFDKLCMGYSIIKHPPQSLLPTVYSSCDVWFSTSKTEGFGLTTLEAMACGVPTMWFKNLGLQEIMQHRNNCVIIKSKKEAKVELMALLSDRDLRRMLRKNGRKVAAQFTWRRTVNLFMNSINSLGIK